MNTPFKRNNNVKKQTNMTTTDTEQTITADKTFDADKITFKKIIEHDTGTQLSENTFVQSGRHTNIQQTGISCYIQQSGANCYIKQTQPNNKIITDGKIGIKNDNPAYDLDVNGKVRMDFGGSNGSLEFENNGIYFEGINDGGGNNDWAFIGRPNSWSQSVDSTSDGGNSDLIIMNGNNWDNDIYIYASGSGNATRTSTPGNQARVILQHHHGTSDNRIKHNEEIITNALSDIRQLVPKKYWKTENVLYDENHNFELDISGYPIDSSGNRVAAYIEHGLIAQDVLKINSFNHLVGPPKERSIHKTYTLNYMSIFTHAIAAIKELDAEHTITKQELENEKAKIISLEARIQALEQK